MKPNTCVKENLPGAVYVITDLATGNCVTFRTEIDRDEVFDANADFDQIKSWFRVRNRLDYRPPEIIPV